MTPPPAPARLPKLALVGFLVLLAISLAIGLLLASRPGPRAAPPAVVATLPDFELLDSSGGSVSLDDLRGRPWVATMIFTRCPFSCPRMVERLRGLGPGLERAGGGRRVSITVDPVYDRPDVLAAYRAEQGIDDPDWLFLTGEREQIVELVRKGFLLGLDLDPPENAAEPILHSTRFVLVDAAGRIRGYYDAFQVGEIQRLLADVAAVNRETGDRSP